MATSSITHNFIYTDHEVVERLAKILEESANDPPMPITVDVKHLRDPDEIREFMEKIERALAARSDSEEEQRV